MNKGVDTADPSHLTVLDLFFNEAAGESKVVMILHLSEKLPADPAKANDSSLNVWHISPSLVEYAVESSSVRRYKKREI